MFLVSRLAFSRVFVLLPLSVSRYFHRRTSTSSPPTFFCFVLAIVLHFAVRIKPPTSRRPSDEQVAVSASLVDAMMMPEEAEEERRGIRTGLVLNPVKQLINQ